MSLLRTPDIENKREQAGHTEVGLQDALSLAIRLHRTGQLDAAETVYRRVLDITADYPDALHFLGVLSHQRGMSDEGIELIQRSIAVAPDQSNFYNNLGNVLIETGRFGEAGEAYEKAIGLAPEHADAYNNFGALQKALGDLEAAAAAYEKAIELAPNHADAHNNMGNLLSAQGRTKEAVAYYCKAVTISPQHPQAKQLLGIGYYTLGQVEAAAEVFRQWLSDEPENAIAKHMLAACSGEDVPIRASDAYIEKTFDSFAGSFDAKLQRLTYRAPHLIAQALANSGVAPKSLIGLDAGCGTGLCGPLIAPYVSRLIGIDLSAQMLARAKARGVYDELVKGELTAYLAAQPGVFDLIVSADTLCYFGALDSVFAAAREALRENGLLAFTVESADASPPGYRINPHGRYSHDRDYLSRALVAAGFSSLAIDSAHLRMENGEPVLGFVVTCRRRARVASAMSSSPRRTPGSRPS